MALGTAPRLVNGKWVTRTGRTLSAKGQTYWSNLHAQGRTDGQGHIQRFAKAEQATAPPKKPSFDTLLAASKGDQQARAQVRIYSQSKRARQQAKADVQAATDRQFASAIPLAARANKTVNPVAGAVIKSLSPSTALKQAGSELRHGKVLQAGLSAASVIPAGRGLTAVRDAKVAAVAAKAARAEAIGRAGLTDERALVAGQKAQQITEARSRVTRVAIEKPADIVSKAIPKVPLVGERARVMKAAGRETRKEQHRAISDVASEARALPKKGSDEDAAHFWFAHLPPELHNAKGLETVKAGLQRELDRTLRREPIPLEKKASKNVAAKQARVARLQTAYDRAVARAGETAVPHSPEITRTLARRVTPEGVAAGRRKAIVTSAPSEMPPRGTYTATTQRLGSALSVAKDELATAEKIAGRPPKLGKVRTAGLPQQARNIAQQIAHLDRIIATNPTAKPEVLNTLRRFDQEHLKTLREVGFLESSDPEARRAIVAHWLGAKPSGQEIYIGHRPGKVPGSGGLRSIGLGKPKAPSGAVGKNRLVLVRTGAVRPSTHVAAEDLVAAHTYRNALRARKDLWQAADPFPGHLPQGYRLVNPDGQIVPATWKTDQLSGIADNPQMVEQKSQELLQGFLGDQSNWKEMVADAQATGTLDKLRIIPERDVKRYYAQFLPVSRATVGGRVYDKMIDATAMSLIFARIGYVPKNILQNLITSVPHQGVFFPMNAFRSAQLIPRPGQSELARKVWNLLVTESGGGVSGSLAQEATSKALGTPARIATALADQPARVSALLHELAAEDVIPKLSFHLSEDDLHAILNAYEKNRPKWNKTMQRGVDAMGDFDRMTPVQRRYMRRFLIVPGWLAAGTRYPIHFAATHPGRSAAMAYVAAGEPGAPEQLQVNKPLDEYLLRGNPSYVPAVSAEHWPHILGGGKDKQFRLGSLLPGAIPADVGISLAQGAPIPTAASYVNPFPEALSNIAHSTYQTSSGETKKTTFPDALRSSLQRLVPGETFAQRMIAPGSVPPSKMYPDNSRLGGLAREVGIVPVRVDKQAAQQAQMRERGQTKALQAAADQEGFYKAVDAAGLEPSPEVHKAYDLKVELAKKLDGIHAHGLTYYRRAYTTAVMLAADKGFVSRKDARAAAAAVGTYKDPGDEAALRKALDDLRSTYFGGDTIRNAKRELTQAGVG